MREFTASSNDNGVRLSRFIQNVSQNLPSSVLHKGIRNKRIKVNNLRTTAEYHIATGDIISLYLNDEYFPTIKNTNYNVTHNNADINPLQIVWEDDSIAILYKPSGLLSHSDAINTENLLNDFIFSLTEEGVFKPDTESSFRPALCNRIDRGTEGLVAAAKTYAALRDMNELIRDGFVAKTYLCICLGIPPSGVQNAFLTRDKTSKTVHISVTSQSVDAKPIQTGIKVLETYQNFSLCEIDLITGRTHQIRAHLAFLGHPILGDRKYTASSGGRPLPPSNSPKKFKNQALCAWQLTFGEELPSQNTLCTLAGQSFTANKFAKLPAQWRAIHPGTSMFDLSGEN